jgi:hypothetical protein
MFHRSDQILVRYLLLPVALASLLLTMASAQNSPTMQTTVPPQQQPAPPQQTAPPSSDGSSKGNPRRPVPKGSPPSSVVTASRQPSAKGGHDAETNPGRTPHGSGNGAAIAAGALGAVAAGVFIHELSEHNKDKGSPEQLGHNGPEVPKQINMSGFAIKGLVGPNWPVVLDFLIDSPGVVQIDITAADKRHYHVNIKNAPNYRAYAIFRLPPNFGSATQAAVFQVQTAPVQAGTAGTSATAPALRTYGIGAGEKAVGSVAIDQLTFQPPSIHPKAKEFATYGFHAHSAFDGVRAEFVYTTSFNGSVLVQKDEGEKTLTAIPEGERARGTWDGKGKAGEHMMQIRAWRGLENGGDWVVAWSPDIVDVVK